MTTDRHASTSAPPGRYHVVGVGGPGMSAIALVLAGMGHEVSGSDLRDLPVLERLRAAGVTVHVGHRRDHVDGADAVTGSTAIPAANVELDEARRRGVPVLRRAGMLASICACARTVAVAGTHGKTTTTSMLTMILTEAGLQPSFIVGGDVNDVGTGAHWTDSEHLLVVEADESDGTFLELPADGTILTNVEVDHLDYYGTPEAIVARLRRLPRRRARAEGRLRRRPGRRPPRRRPRRRHLRHIGGGDVPHRRPGRRPRRRHVHRGPRRRAPRRGAPAPARGAHGPQRHRRHRHGPSPRGALRGVRGGPGPLRGRGPPLRLPGRPRRHHLRRRLRPPPRPRSPPCSKGAATSGDGWAAHRRRVPAQPLQPHGGAVAGRTATPSPAPTSRSSPTSTRRARRPAPASPGSSWSTPCSTPTRGSGWRGSRGASDLIDYLAGELRPGDVCISMGCGDVASLPSEVLARLSERAAVGS